MKENCNKAQYKNVGIQTTELMRYGSENSDAQPTQYDQFF